MPIALTCHWIMLAPRGPRSTFAARQTASRTSANGINILLSVRGQRSNLSDSNWLRQFHWVCPNQHHGTTAAVNDIACDTAEDRPQRSSPTMCCHDHGCCHVLLCD